MTWMRPLLAGVLLAASAVKAESILTAEKQQQVHSIFAEIDKTDVPGCAVGVYHDSGSVFTHGYGSANLELDASITPDSLFNIASVTKQFTAAALTLLEQQGKLSFDDNIRKYLPEMPDYGSPITIDHLVHHTSGLRTYDELHFMAGYTPPDYISMQKSYRAIRRQKALNFTPGERHEYSNTGYLLTALIIEKVSGQPFTEFMQENLFAPLGMTHSQFADDHRKVMKNRASAYEPDENGVFMAGISNWEAVGSSGLFTSINDLMKWEQQLHSPKLGGESFTALLLQEGQLNNGQRVPYARGLHKSEHHGKPAVMHGGYWAGYKSEIVRLPQEKLSVAVLCNNTYADPTGYAFRVIDVMLDIAPPPSEGPASEAKQPVSVKVPPEVFDRYTGNYAFMPGQVLTVSRQGDKYLLANNGGAELPLIAQSQTQFLFPMFGATLNFVAEENSPHIKWSWSDGNSMDLPKLVKASLTDAQLQSLAGTYESKDLGISYTLIAKNGNLIAQSGFSDPITLMPTDEKTFVGDDFKLLNVTFATDENGIETLSVGAGRTNGFVFFKR